MSTDDSSNRTDISTVHLDNISLQNRENVDTNTKFLGFDLSTQQVSGRDRRRLVSIIFRTLNAIMSNKIKMPVVLEVESYRYR